MDDRRLAEIRNYTDRLRQHDIVAFDTLGFAASYLQELLAEVDALRGALEQYADHEHWESCEVDGQYEDWWVSWGRGWTRAEDALTPSTSASATERREQ